MSPVLRVQALGDALQDREIQRFQACAVGEREVTVEEQVAALFQPVLGFQEGLLGLAVFGIGQQFGEVDDHRVTVAGNREFRRARKLFGRGHVGHQNGVVGSKRAARFGNQVRHFDFTLAAQFGQPGNDGVGVLRHGIVHRAERARPAAFVVDPQATPDVQHCYRNPGGDQLGVVTTGLAHAVLNIAQVRDLRAHVKMQQLEPVQAAGFAYGFDQFQQLAGGQPELGALTTGVLPVALAQRRQAQPHAQHRIDAQCPGVLVNQRPLAGLFDHDDDLQSKQDRAERQAHILGILVTVAHHECRPAG